MVSAACYGCTLGLATVRDLRVEEPVGNCWLCHVFACHGHGAIDRGSGKFLCAVTVGHGLLASSGMADPDVDDEDMPQFASHDEFVGRFPGIASTIHRWRLAWAPDEPWTENLRQAIEAHNRRVTDWELVIDAIALATHLLSTSDLEVGEELFGPFVSSLIPAQAGQ